MVRRTLALVTTTLVLTVGCGAGHRTSGSETPVSNRSPVGVPPAAGPGAPGRGPDPRCQAVEDHPVRATARDQWVGPLTEIAPDCSGIDPEPFRAETVNPAIGSV